eukprot:scaffold73462_cov68-Phaeocystis_antarctica.AAC.1
MCELVWGEPGTFVKRRVRRKHPLYGYGFRVGLGERCRATAQGALGWYRPSVEVSRRRETRPSAWRRTQKASQFPSRCPLGSSGPAVRHCIRPLCPTSARRRSGPECSGRQTDNLVERHTASQRQRHRRLWRRLARAFEAAAGRPVGRSLPWERQASRSCQARPEEARKPNSGTA